MHTAKEDTRKINQEPLAAFLQGTAQVISIIEKRPLILLQGKPPTIILNNGNPLFLTLTPI